MTNDQGVAQFLQVNGVQFNEYGLPILVNMLGNIDVEILIDEGPDNETVMGDVFDLLMSLAQNNVPVPPQAIIEASTLPLSEKKKLQAMVGQVDPMQQQTKQLQIAGLGAEVQKKQAEVQKTQAQVGHLQTGSMLNVAKARNEGSPDAPQPPPTPLDTAQKLADINETNATAQHKRASAETLQHKALFAPLQTLADHAQQNASRVVDTMHQNADRAVNTMHQNADRALDHFHRTADRDAQAQLARMKAMKGQPPE